MKISEAKDKAVKLKKEFKNFEEYITKNGQDRVRFNLGEYKAPKGFENERFNIMFHEGKNYIIFTLKLGKNKKCKEEDMQKRKVKYEAIKKLRIERSKAARSRDYSKMSELDTEIDALRKSK